MQVTDLSDTAATNGPAASASSVAGQTLSGDFDSFIQLLTTQVTNQDPLEPIDSTQFVEQLATFSALEQQVATNAHLEAITGLIQGSIGGEAAQGLLGQTVTAEDITVTGPFAPLQIVAPAESEGRLVVTDAAGDRVFTGEPGDAWSWDGRTVAGAPVPDGRYSFSIETSSGELLPARALASVDRVIQGANGAVEAGLGAGVTTGSFEKV